MDWGSVPHRGSLDDMAWARTGGVWDEGNECDVDQRSSSTRAQSIINELGFVIVVASNLLRPGYPWAFCLG